MAAAHTSTVAVNEVALLNADATMTYVHARATASVAATPSVTPALRGGRRGERPARRGLMDATAAMELGDGGSGGTAM